MKKLVLCLVLGFSTMSYSMPISGGIGSELKNKVNVDLSAIQLNKYEEDYVLVDFKVVDGMIEIVKASGTQSDLIELMVSELQTLVVESGYEKDMVYRYKFTFEKV